VQTTLRKQRSGRAIVLGLPEVQARFARALLGSDDAAIADAIAEDGLSPTLRLDVHRNTVLVSLIEVLADAFPAVCRLVNERFFRYAAAEFVRAHPPARACLSVYGDRLPDFLAAFPPCRELAYLPDVARLEWLMHRAVFTEDAEPLSPAALSGVAEPQRLMLELDPSLGLMSSPWPIDRIWRANRPDADGAEGIDLSSGGARLEVRRIAGVVVLRSLDAGSFAFRAALSRRSTLARAAEAALAADPGFDLTTAFADLFHDSSVVAFALEDKGA
jgi:hypothetical protein